MFIQQITKIWDVIAPYFFIGVLISIFAFARGIFTTKGGHKAWFELCLMSATILASGYLLWWQIPMLLLAVILGTFSAGVFSVIAPQYIDNFNLSPEQQVLRTVKRISTQNKEYLKKLPPNKIEEYLKKVRKAEKGIHQYLNLTHESSNLHDILDIFEDTQHIADEIIEDHNREIELIRQEEERNRMQEEEKIQKQKRQLQELRKRYGYSLGHPPIKDRFGNSICPYGYPVKVPMNRTRDGYDSIVWHPQDGKRYENVIPQWCYSSIQEAMLEKNYRYRRPDYGKSKNN